jgi:hypothetical protein
LNKDQKRYDALQKIGCICCRKLGYPQQAADMHHILRGTHRIGNHATLPLCRWHHVAVWSDRFRSKKLAQTLLGPSLSENSKAFHERFGSDEALLEEVEKLIK